MAILLVIGRSYVNEYTDNYPEIFKDATGKIWCIDIMKMNQDSWESEIQEGWTAVSKDEADKIANPPPTKAQLIEQAEAQKQFLIAEVHTETEMIRAKLALKRIKPDEEALLNAGWIIWICWKP